LTIVVVKLVVKFYVVAKISQIYCWSILIWATLYNFTLIYFLQAFSIFSYT